MRPGISRLDWVQCGMGRRRLLCRKSISAWGARTGSDSARARGVVRSPGASREGKDQHNVEQRKQQQAIRERNMRKEPAFQKHLQSVMVVETVFLPNERRDPPHGCLLL